MSGGGEGGKRVIVIAIDESDHAEHAFNFFMDNYSKPHDRILVVHCQEYRSVTCTPTGPVDAYALRTAMDEEDKHEKLLMEKFGDKLREKGAGGQVKSCYGKAGEALVHEAKTHDAALIVAGTRGMGAIRRTLLGSVTDYLIHHAHCPVFICREQETSN